MIKYLMIALVGVPYVIYSEIIMLYYRISKASNEKAYKRLRKTVLFINKLLRIKIEVFNKEYIENIDGVVIASNHLSVIDIITIIGLSPKPLFFISKIENKKVPFLNTHLKAVGCLSIDRHDLKQSLHISKEAGQLVNEGKNVVIFAEGTRNKEGKVAKFKAAFPTIVHYSKKDTVLICLENTNKVMKYRPLYPKTDVRVYIFKPISYEFYKEHKKDFNDITQKMVSDKLEELKNEYSRDNRKES